MNTKVKRSTPRRGRRMAWAMGALCAWTAPNGGAAPAMAETRAAQPSRDPARALAPDTRFYVREPDARPRA